MTFGRLALLALLGISSQILAVAIWLAIKSATGFDIANFWVNLIIPLGPLLLGFVAGFGFTFARHIDAPAGPSMLTAMIGFSLAGAAFMQFASYWIAQSDGAPLREMIGFVDYLRLTNANSAMRIGMHESASVVEVGRLGYVLTLAEMVAYVVASLWVYASVRGLPYCQPCARYLRDKEVLRLPFRDIPTYSAYARTLPHDGRMRMMAHRDWRSDYRPLISEQGMTTLVATLSACPNCAQRQLNERVVHVGAQGPGPIDDFADEFAWSEKGGSKTQASPRAASPMPSGFGRKPS